MADPYSSLKVPEPDSNLTEILKFSQFFGYKNAADRMDQIHERVWEAYKEGRLEEIPFKELGNAIFFIFRDFHKTKGITRGELEFIRKALELMKAKSED